MPVVFSGYQHTLYLITCFSFNRIPYNTGFAALHFHNSSYSQLFIFAAFHFRSSSGETGEREKKKKRLLTLYFPGDPANISDFALAVRQYLRIRMRPQSNLAVQDLFRFSKT